MRRYIQVGLLGGTLLILQWISVPLYSFNSNWSHALALLVELPFWLFGALGYGILLLLDLLLAGGRLSLPSVMSPILAILRGDALGPIVFTNLGQLLLSTAVYGLLLRLAQRVHPERRARACFDLFVSCTLAILVVWLHAISNLFHIAQQAASVGVFLQGLLHRLVGLSVSDSLLTSDLPHQYFLWDTIALTAITAAIVFVVIRLARRLLRRPATHSTSPAGPKPERNQVGIRAPHAR